MVTVQRRSVFWLSLWQLVRGCTAIHDVQGAMPYTLPCRTGARNSRCSRIGWEGIRPYTGLWGLGAVVWDQAWMAGL